MCICLYMVLDVLDLEGVAVSIVVARNGYKIKKATGIESTLNWLGSALSVLEIVLLPILFLLISISSIYFLD